jgi:hypothetical protein
MKGTLTRKVAADSVRLLVALMVLAIISSVAGAQGRPQPAAAQSEHDDQILGVRIGMSVPEALKAVYEHTATNPAPQKPDALKEEGKDKQDVRVVYKSLKEGELEIVFAGGKTGFVRALTLRYTKQPTMSDLHLLPTGSIDVMTVRNDAYANILNEGQRYDTRYSVGFTDDRKTERYWWRDERRPGSYEVRVGFISKKITGRGFGAVDDWTIARKVVLVKPGDEEKFWKTVAPK